MECGFKSVRKVLKKNVNSGISKNRNSKILRIINMCLDFCIESKKNPPNLVHWIV